MILRDELINQAGLLRTYQKTIGVLYKLKKIPLIRKIVRKIATK